MKKMKTMALTQDPLSIELIGADESGKRLFKYFVDKLNDELAKRYQEAIWLQPDSSNYDSDMNRYQEDLQSGSAGN